MSNQSSSSPTKTELLTACTDPSPVPYEHSRPSHDFHKKLNSVQRTKPRRSRELAGEPRRTRAPKGGSWGWGWESWRSERYYINRDGWTLRRNSMVSSSPLREDRDEGRTADGESKWRNGFSSSLRLQIPHWDVEALFNVSSTLIVIHTFDALSRANILNHLQLYFDVDTRVFGRLGLNSWTDIIAHLIERLNLFG